MLLHDLLAESVRRYPARIAVSQKDGQEVNFEELSRLADGVRNGLLALGVQPGDRVGIYLRKSISAVAAIFGVLKSGAAYVPVDSSAPASRNGYIFSNCEVRAVIVEDRFADDLSAELAHAGHEPHLCVVREALDSHAVATLAPDGGDDQADVRGSAEDLAYILYTSGSTGKPKGVRISHGNAASFVEWCRWLLDPVPDDVFSSHAPFHFDLSILDIYTSISSGAKLVLIDESLGKNPGELARLISESGVSIWYSAPSILSMLVEFGRLEQFSFPRLRTVLFAGEVFPVAPLRQLKSIWSTSRFFNLYGPTETNVCTFYEIPESVPAERTEAFPIGKVCHHLQGRVVDEQGTDVIKGAEGELCIQGPSVTAGYWGLPEQTRNAYLAGDGHWYRTGDLVREDESGDYVFIGRRDRMIKKRGNRIELGEIESCLYQHDDVVEAAVVSTSDLEHGVRVVAHLATRSGDRLSAIQLKKFCAERLPVYMVPDSFTHHPTLPKTSTDKIDYQSLLKTPG